MSKAVCLKLGGKPLELNPATPTEQKALIFLNAAAADDLFPRSELAEKLGVALSSLTKGNFNLPDGYSVIFRGQRVYGNPKAITELLRQVAQ